MIYIYGEAHFQKESLDYIAEEIRRIKPGIIFHELVDTELLKVDEVSRQLKKCGTSNSVCDPDLNIDVFELAVEVGAMLTSFDLPEKEKVGLKTLSLASQFAAREHCMVRRLSAIPRGFPRDIVVVVGDAHLRNTASKELGPKSPIVSFAENNKQRVTIVRTKKEFREIE